MVALFVCGAVAALPVEFVVDCTGAPGIPGQFTLTFRYECRDGTVLGNPVRGDLRASPAHVVDALTFPLRHTGWRIEKLGNPGDEPVFVIRGSKTSPIKSVTFKGDVWAPTVTPRIVLPPPAAVPAPGPREK